MSFDKLDRHRHIRGMSDKERNRRADAKLKQKVLSRWENEGGRVAPPAAKRKRPRDVIGNAVRVMEIATGQCEEEYDEAEDGKSKAAVELGRKGGKARAEKMSAERRREIAEKAARKRWGGSG